jgi:Fur family transcriptional regulator, ferric uptake regulator
MCATLPFKCTLSAASDASCKRIASRLAKGGNSPHHQTLTMIASTQTNHPIVGVKNGKDQTPVEVACHKLKEAGLRITQPRVAILAALIRTGRPTSIDALHSDLGPNSCDIVTVYRCMAAFESIGLVRRAFLINGTSLYEINLGDPNRYHVVCKQTNRVEELDAASANELRRAVQTVEETLRSQGYSEVGHIVEFFGKSPVGVRTSVEATVPAVPAT